MRPTVLLVKVGLDSKMVYVKHAMAMLDALLAKIIILHSVKYVTITYITIWLTAMESAKLALIKDVYIATLKIQICVFNVPQAIIVTIITFVKSVYKAVQLALMLKFAYIAELVMGW